MESTRNTEATGAASDDLSALAWVHDELRRSLDAAHKALRRFVKEAESLTGSDVDVVDPSVLRTARQQIHQGVGALELVGLPAAATVLRACEAAVQRYVAKPQKLTSEIVDDLEKASFALLDYLARMLAGKVVSPLAMFPQYRAVQEAAGADRVHPADLWAVDWRWRDVPLAGNVTPRKPDSDTRAALEREMLALMRGPSPAAAMRMSDLCEGLAAGSSHSQAATLWKLAAAMFEAQGQGLSQQDVFSKRVASRLLAQLRIVERGEGDASERLAQDLLFFCAQASSPGDGRKAPRLASVRQAYGLVHHTPVDYTVSALGKFDPAWIAQAKKRVVAAKESWSAIAGGEMHRMSGLGEQFSLVGDSLKRLFPQGESMANELTQAVSLTQTGNAAPSAPLAMEVATSLLYIEASLEDADFDHPDQGQRVRRLADRVSRVRQGAAPEPLEGWMEDLYRRVSDRQTMGSVVQELRTSLSEAEKLIDQFFRNPVDRNVLIPVPNQLTAMRGVLSVLGMDQASQALLRMRDEVDGLITTEIQPEHVQQAGVFDRLAGNLGALGFLIDMLSVQPQMAKSLFRYDASTGSLSPVMGRSEERQASEHTAAANAVVEPRLIEQAQQLAFTAARDDVPLEEVSRDLERLSAHAQAADQPSLAATVSQAQAALHQAEGDAENIASVRDSISEAMVDFVNTASGPMGLDVLPPAPPPAQVAAPAAADMPATAAPAPTVTVTPPAPATVDLAEDDEMREIFLEEAREVVETATGAINDLEETPSDIGHMTTVRRAFHTLKGSSRMVGLKRFGDAAWGCEQLYNARLADQQPADAGLLEFTRWSLGYLGEWIEEIAEGRDGGRDPKVVENAALAMRESGSKMPVIGAATAAPVAVPAPIAPAPVVEALPELDLDLPPVAETIEMLEIPDIDEHPAPVAGMEPLALSLPPDLPTAQDLELGSAPVAEHAPAPAAPAEHELSFELDLASFDAPVEPVTAPTDALGVDTKATSLFDPFEVAQTAPLPMSEPTTAAQPLVEETIELIDLDLGTESPPEEALIENLEPSLDLPLEEVLSEDLVPAAHAVAATDMPLEATPEPETVSEAAPTAPEDDQFKIVGPLRISIPLFNIYLNEADELSRRLTTEVAEWAMELHRPVGEAAIALAHSLAGNSATVGFTDLSQLARTLEHALMRIDRIGHGEPDDGKLFVDTAEDIRRLLHQFAAGFLKEPTPELLARLAEHEVSSARRLEAVTLEQDAQPVEEAANEPLIEVLEPTPGVEHVMETAPEPVAELPEIVMPQALAEVQPEPLHEPLPDAIAQAAEAVHLGHPHETHVEVVDIALPPSEPEPVEAAPATDFGTPDSKFGQLGLAEFKPFTALPSEAVRAATPVREDQEGVDDDIDAVDAVDADLFPIFEEEGQELLPKLEAQLRDWADEPANTQHAAACMRTLHTLKGGARLAGAMRLGEMAHRLESAIEQLLAKGSPEAHEVEALHNRSDALSHTFEALRRRDAAAYADALASTEVAKPAPVAPVAAPVQPAAPVAEPVLAKLEPVALAPVVPTPDLPAVIEPSAVDEHPSEPLAPFALPDIDWSRFTGTGAVIPKQAAADRASASQSAVRVRAPLLDRLVNQAGEVSITRSRIEVEVNTIKGSLGDLTDNLERLRQQLRDIELQAETQMSSRLEAAKALAQSFDPLEFDRFTRFQELTRMMAESVNDVATVQRTLQRTLESTEDELAAQARLTRDLQDDLLRTRMVEFEGLSDRLYRVVRQAAKETGKQVRLDIVGGSIEVDRGVLDRMTGAFEHLLRNSVTHGIESPDVRAGSGKDAAGSIVVALTQEGNEVGVEFRDDGAGLNLARIREKGVNMGLIEAAHDYSDGELANLIFTSGFSTADKVTELAGRGIGMDVVRAEVNAMGGRIETATAAGQGTSFKLVLPLTTAVTQVVMLRVGDTTVAVPSTLIEIVRRAKPEEIDHAYNSGRYAVGDHALNFFWLGSLLQLSPRSSEATGRMRQIVIIRSAQQRIAIHVDEVLGNQEVVVKNLGPQLSRMPGLAGMTLLASGAVALIYNPVALAALYGPAARAATVASLHAPTPEVVQPVVTEPTRPAAPLVLVVDDSLTVRRVTQRLLVREGYRVSLAKDGLDALERLAEEKPQMVLSDIEMPRMDGFDLVRNIRGDARLRDLPVIMITSRIAQKHRDYAAELGVDHYLGKPYSEEDLLALIGRYTANAAAV
ncbi:hybrid sensor histidine kinase/response regulator [Piscinibacter terrae]|uniref:Chemotaxis protein CheA n=1 Tax=Piscinibacter terrae TaxID=2496871 RepID=A0A3N7HHM6_9BURK|nr:Hpt domain-containing protein [Albitalea terrae]RQP21554.1 response regulator [Albitalea terrae]